MHRGALQHGHTHGTAASAHGRMTVASLAYLLTYLRTHGAHLRSGSIACAGAARARGDELPRVPHGLDQRPQLCAPAAARRRRRAVRRRLRPLRGALG